MNSNESRESEGRASNSGGGGGGGSEEPAMRSPGHRGSASAGAGAGGGGGGRRAAGGVYGREEVSALRGIFKLYDAEETGTIGIKELEGILQKVGYNPDDVVRVLDTAAELKAGTDGRVSFDEFLGLLEQAGPAGPLEGPDPKVMEFLRILEEYRVKCEEGGDYLEAGRAQRQLDVLRRQETRRQQKAVRARQLCERQDVQVAHNMQFQDFNGAWSKYLQEYDRMAQMYVQQMTERHAIGLMEHQRKLQQELRDKPPKWSKSELQALLKRIDARRKEHIKQRNLDSKRLLQRNRNVQTVLESKQNVEGLKLTDEIKKGMMTSTPPDPSHKIPPEARGKVRRKKKSSGAGAVTRTSSAGGGGEDMVAGDGEGGGGKDRTFVTSREFPEEQKSSVG
eukprot:jgi/Undpi1/2615/HiC_scaffold_13.g05994.m1